MRRNRSILIILIITLLLVWQYNQEDSLQAVSFTGSTMGTTYSIKYLVLEEANYQDQIDSILIEVNQAVSTYIPDSEISIFNRGTQVSFKLPHFYRILKASDEIYQQTGGAFNPAVMPLVNAWGFGPDGHQTPDSSTVDSLLILVDFPSIQYDLEGARKTKAGVQLDFSAIAKGYGVDAVAEFLESMGVENYLVDIGGEVACQGVNEIGQIWRIGINIPYEEAPLDSKAAVVELQDRAIATSGNYRNYYIKDGVKYAHTINPVSGYPIDHSLLSASVFSSRCMIADAYATSFMVMGLERARALVEQKADLEAVLIYNDEDGELTTYISDGIKEYVSLTHGAPSD